MIVIVQIISVTPMSLVIVTRMESIVRNANRVSNLIKAQIIVKIVKLEHMAQLKILSLLANNVQMVSFKIGWKNICDKCPAGKIGVSDGKETMSRQRVRNAWVILIQGGWIDGVLSVRWTRGNQR